MFVFFNQNVKKNPPHEIYFSSVRQQFIPDFPLYFENVNNKKTPLFFNLMPDHKYS